MSLFSTDAAVYSHLPYCGSPPTPATLAYRWNLDPVLLTGLTFALFAYAVWSQQRLRGGHAIAPWRRASFLLGWAVAALALTSPLCPLSVSLFSARVGQHMLLAAIAAPLIALGRPGWVLATRWSGMFSRRPSLPIKKRGTSRPFRAIFPAILFAAALWFWHAPAPYAATFQSNSVYWLMHLTLFGVALWLWSDLLEIGDDLVGFVAATVFTTAQMSLLGAAITFADHPLYAPHQLTTAPWGLTPLADQQLGGIVMWVPAGVIFVAAFIAAFAAAMRRAEKRSLLRAPA